MLIAIIAMTAGLIVLMWSADYFIEGAAEIAKRMGISKFVVGLTIVSIGTSAPEILVSINAALTGAGELAIGNAIGSNIANIGLVLGITCLVIPLSFQRSAVQKNIWIMVAISLAIGLLVLDRELSRLDAVLMILGLTAYLWQLGRHHRQEQQTTLEETLSNNQVWLRLVVGLSLLLLSSRILVWAAVSLAEQLGVSNHLIGLTVVAIGTSLPELSATIAGAKQGHMEIAIGNILGSNIFNLLAVMSIPGIVGPGFFEHSVVIRDYPVMLLLTFILAFLASTSFQNRQSQIVVGRAHGSIFLFIFAAYFLYLYSSNFNPI